MILLLLFDENFLAVNDIDAMMGGGLLDTTEVVYRGFLSVMEWKGFYSYWGLGNRIAEAVELEVINAEGACLARGVGGAVGLNVAGADADVDVALLRNLEIDEHALQRVVVGGSRVTGESVVLTLDEDAAVVVALLAEILHIGPCEEAHGAHVAGARTQAARDAVAARLEILDGLI